MGSVIESDDLEKLGRHELVTRIATGGMAEIFLARQRGLAGFERLVVIKRILPHLADREDFIAMFLREARIVAQVTHPNVVQIHELGEIDGTYFITMEYIHGCTLREIQVLGHRADSPMPLGVAVSIIAAACRGAHAAHELTDASGKLLGLVHRDISPHNIMVTGHGHTKLLDFGIAKEAEGFETTSADDVRGKYGYMSPEQCQRDPLDRRSDVFSLGTILWELVAGRPLFKRKSELEMMKAITESDAPPVQIVNPAVPDVLDAIIMRALERDRDARFESAEEMRLALDAAARDLHLDTSTDAVASFTHEVAGERLAERDEVVEKVRQRALDASEERALIHSTDTAAIRLDGTPSGANGRARSAPNRLPSGPVREAGLSSGRFPRDQVFDEDATDDRLRVPGSRGRWVWLSIAIMVLSAGLVWKFILGSATQAEGHAEDNVAPTWTGAPVTLGWPPTVDPAVLRQELEPLRRYLETSLSRPVSLQMAASYRELADWVVSGKVDIGTFPPLLYVQTSERAADKLRLVVVKQFDGATSSDGYLLIRQGSSIDSVEDLRGRSFCFTDQSSTTGHFLPKAFLRRQGFDPDTFIGSVHWSGDHLQVLRDLLAEKCDAAATYSGALLTSSNLGLPSGRFRVLAVTGHIPQDVFVAGPSADAQTVDSVRAALLAFAPKDVAGAAYLGESQRITGFSAATEELFTSLRGVVAEQQPAPADAAPPDP